MLDPYLWLKWAHIVSVISWMAGLLYLPRLFVYHAECGSGSPQAETFKVMERRLYRAIMTPAMVASWLFGLGLAYWLGVGISGNVWFWLKLVCVAGLTAFHGHLGRFVKAFAHDEIKRDPRYFRLINEVPTLIMLAVVFLVVFKPF
ncbi:MAG: protoporphyrinogen oxidase HemJ [Pseudomonadota bacterium]